MYLKTHFLLSHYPSTLFSLQTDIIWKEKGYEGTNKKTNEQILNQQQKNYNPNVASDHRSRMIMNSPYKNNGQYKNMEKHLFSKLKAVSPHVFHPNVQSWQMAPGMQEYQNSTCKRHSLVYEYSPRQRVRIYKISRNLSVTIWICIFYQIPQVNITRLLPKLALNDRYKT